MLLFLQSALLSILLVFTTTLLYYEILRITWIYLPKLHHISPRKRVIVVIAAVFSGHSLAVLIYGICYWALARLSNFGALAGDVKDEFLHYLYFSAETYSSLGIGDIFPIGGFRLLASVEVLNGLVLIGCSVSFMYLVMHKFWDQPDDTKADH